jgi:hypothetical protein
MKSLILVFALLAVLFVSLEGSHVANAVSQYQVILSYSVEPPGGQHVQPPTVQYVQGGEVKTATLTTKPTTYTIDSTSSWMVSSLLQGSNSTQRWALLGANVGIGSKQTRNLTYYRQELVTFSYSWRGNGRIFPLNQVNYTTFGKFNLTYPVTTVWADFGSRYSYGNKSNNNLPLNSRWFVVGKDGAIEAPGTISAGYFEQYKLSFGVNFLGPDVFKSTTLTESYGGAIVNHTLTTVGGTFWVDYNSSFSVQQAIYSTAGPYRWFLYTLNDSVAYASKNVQALYVEQFPLTITYGVSGGAGSSPPELTATIDRQVSTLQLIPGTSVTWVDAEFGYQVSNPLLGSSPNERWFTPSSTEGVANGPVDLNIVFYYQILVPLDYTVVGGGTVPPFDAGYTSFGSIVSVPIATTPTNLWVDYGTPLGVPWTFAGSTQFERWDLGNPPSAPLTAPGALSLVYYHQFYVPFVYIVSSQGNPPSPILTGSQFGVKNSWPLASGTSTWLDGDSPWSISGILQNSASGERWAGSGSLNGTVSTGAPIIAAYQHEFYVSVTSNPEGAGTLSGGGWVQAGQAIAISANPSHGYAFMRWEGSGQGAYSGQSENFSVTVSAPMQEVAQYDLALLVHVSGRGSVSVEIGSSTYTVGNQLTFYLAPGTHVTLVANAGLLEDFSGWQGVPGGRAGAVAFTAESPLVVNAAFTIDQVQALGVVTLYVGIAAFAIIYLVWNRRSGRIFHRMRSYV